jgi:nucleoside-diphosphate-sugar epimerase
VNGQATNALVTGGGGFLGQYIVEQLLARGDRVTVFARGSYPDLEAAGARTIRGSVEDAEAIGRACAGMDMVFHVAAKAGLWGPWPSFWNTNVLGTRNAIAACRNAGVRRLVYTSSPSVVFGNRPQAGCDESLPYPTRYESYYPQTKAMAERLVVEASRQEGTLLLAVVLRPHLIWGARDTHILPGLLERARQGKLMQVGDGTNRADLTYVEDAARAHLLAADALLQAGSPAAGSTYFISQDEPVAIWPWINDLLRELDIPPVRGQISLPVARAAGAAMELTHRTLRLPGEPRLTRFLASELAMDHYYDISRAKRDLGYTPQYSMQEALQKTLPFLKEGQDREGRT